MNVDSKSVFRFLLVSAATVISTTSANAGGCAGVATFNEYSSTSLSLTGCEIVNTSFIEPDHWQYKVTESLATHMGDRWVVWYGPENKTVNIVTLRSGFNDPGYFDIDVQTKAPLSFAGTSWIYEDGQTVEMGTYGQFKYLDHTAPVPEPESYALFIAGLAVIMRLGRRRKNLGERAW